LLKNHTLFSRKSFIDMAGQWNLLGKNIVFAICTICTTLYLVGSYYRLTLFSGIPLPTFNVRCIFLCSEEYCWGWVLSVFFARYNTHPWILSGLQPGGCKMLARNFQPGDSVCMDSLARSSEPVFNCILCRKHDIVTFPPTDFDQCKCSRSWLVSAV
jgi:hypothetical protein